MYRLLTSLVYLFVKDSEVLHRIALTFLKVAGTPPLRQVTSWIFVAHYPSLHQELFGLHFENPVGIAGGFDKDGEAINGIEALGFGFIEAGSVTSGAQPGNPLPRLFRIPRDQAIINRMGFNNKGAEALKQRLARAKHQVPIGISIGKLKTVDLSQAAEDYLKTFSTLYDYGDYFAVNVSSPNTPGLRDLQGEEHLAKILDALNQFRSSRIRKPILVKISPDLSFEGIDAVLEVVREKGVDGVIATNTTISRDNLTATLEEAGGLSGKPLKKRATEVIRHIHSYAPDVPIIGVGGIFTAEDAYEKIRAGASLVQIYSGFIFQGPLVVKKINNGLAMLLRRDGFKNITEAVGADV